MSEAAHPGLPDAVATERRALAPTNGALVGALTGLFLLPSLLVATGLRAMPALTVAAGSAAAFALVALQPGRAGMLAQSLDPRRLLLWTGVALLVFLLGGGTHLFFPNPDWLIRDAVLADLVRGAFPPAYSVGGEDYLLRAPVGLYMLPALVGRGFGLHAAHLALLIQNAAMLGAILYLLAALGRGWRHVALLLLFAGLCIFPRILRVMETGEIDGLFSTARPLDEWAPYFQYSSSVTQFFWVPNHALPGWWLALIALLAARREIDVATLGVTTAALLLWSPLAILPAVPLLLLFTLRDLRETLASPRTWLGLAAGAAFLPLAVYLTADAGGIAHDLPSGKPDFAVWYGLFILFQLPAAAFVLRCWPLLTAGLRPVFLLSLFLLIALPFFSFGPSNDLVMRGSLAALVVLAFCFGDVLLDPALGRNARFAGGFIAALASLSAASEVARAIRTPTFPISGCTLMEASGALGNPGAPTNYLAATGGIPAWLMTEPAGPRLRSGAPSRDCWPGMESAVSGR